MNSGKHLSVERQKIMDCVGMLPGPTSSLKPRTLFPVPYSLRSLAFTSTCLEVRCKRKNISDSAEHRARFMTLPSVISAVCIALN